jgi:hypothetical protein
VLFYEERLSSNNQIFRKTCINIIAHSYFKSELIPEDEEKESGSDNLMFDLCKLYKKVGEN